MFRGWAKTIARVDRDLSEEALAHAPSETEGAYAYDQATEARRKVMGDYAEWLAPKTNVVPFPQKAA